MDGVDGAQRDMIIAVGGIFCRFALNKMSITAITLIGFTHYLNYKERISFRLGIF